MTRRVPCPPAPGPLEGYAARFDEVFGSLAQRRGFREYLTGLLAPRDRNKTLTALAGAEPVGGAQHAAVQRLQFFLSESRWDPEKVNARRLELLAASPATAAHGGGVLVIDDSGDRKDGTRTAHAGHQYLGRYGKTDNGVVTVTTVWADERLYYPLHAVPYTPARHFAKGKNDPAFKTRLAIGADLAVRARDAGFAFRAVCADSAYGDQDGFRGELSDAGLPYVMALKPRRGTRAYGADAHTPVDAARELAWHGPDEPGDWQPVTRTFRDGHTQTWYAADAQLGWWGPDGARRLVVATADPATLPEKATWYLVTNLPRPAGPRAAESPHPAADLAEITRIYGIRHWIEQSYKQARDELGWADFQVRSDIAIRRHQALVNCAFSFCWDAWFADTTQQSEPAPPRPEPGRGERGAARRLTPGRGAVLAAGTARDTRLAHPLDRAAALVAGMVQSAPATPAPGPDQLGRGRRRPAPLHPGLTNYRYWHEGYLAWQGSVGQGSVSYNRFDPLDDPRVMSLVAAGKRTDDPEVTAIAEAVLAERRGDQRVIGPPGSYRDEIVRAPVQRTLTTDGGWQEYPDHDPDVVAAILAGRSLTDVAKTIQAARAERARAEAAKPEPAPRPVSLPPMTPAAPDGSAT